MTDQCSFDFAVVGGGIVGLATVHELRMRFCDARILLVEKESAVARHQSGRNSGVLHSGIYYRPGSVRAISCRQGKLAMQRFCDEQSISYELCGKIIVATDDREVERLANILQRGHENNIDCRQIDAYEIRQLEPHASGIAAIHVPQAGIVDYPAVCRRLAERFVSDGGQLELGQPVTGIRSSPQQVEISLNDGRRFVAGSMINCGGLYSDQLVRISGLEPPAQIVPFRGEYYQLRSERAALCRNLIYPVPDPNFPFLGVHFTRMTSGAVECGPNAVLALAREGYNWRTMHPSELWQALRYQGFQRLARRHWRTGLGEIKRSLFKSAFVHALQRMIPELRPSDLVPCRSGVRAQAITADGNLVDDFLWVGQGNLLHVCNAPSPAATASFDIARAVVDRLVQQVA
ncbi:MAG: L-2-hydroxyglutarate oxidase [Pirellulaceae bacterium]|nr:L-2-hydroxyglutarate oxidase [Pirellulaceae bacterium]